MENAENPFACPTCERRFTRRENLKRHMALHSQTHEDRDLDCPLCSATFSRHDLRTRHIRLKHSTDEQSDRFIDMLSRSAERIAFKSKQPHRRPRGQQRRASSIDRRQDSVWSGLASSAVEESVLSEMSPQHDAIGAVPKDAEVATWCYRLPSNNGVSNSSVSVETVSMSPEPHSSARMTLQPAHISLGVDLFFQYVDASVPFIHGPTFVAESAPRPLLLAMLALGFQHTERRNLDYPTCPVLSLQCFEEAYALVSGGTEEFDDLVLVQTILLLQWYSLMYCCSSERSPADLHARMINLARSSGLTRSSGIQNALGDATGLDQLWLDFVRSESRKRTMLCVHQADAIRYQLLSIPRALSHLEIKQELPLSEELWAADSSSSWAYLRLQCGAPSSAITYEEAVRHTLSFAVKDRTLLTSCAPYGINNLTHFLLSSVREASGWATMSGHLSVDRIDSLRSSLISIEPLVRRTHVQHYTQTHLICESLWQIAIIDLHLWSLSHTLGLVHLDLKALLRHTTAQALTQECFDLDAAVTELLRPHLEYFLNILADANGPPLPPLVLLYAYQAFLIALQVAKTDSTILDSWPELETSPGGCGGLIAQVRRAFERYGGLEVVGLILQSLDMIERSQLINNGSIGDFSASSL